MSKTIFATIWSILDKVGAQIVSFAIGIVLARLLTPEDYGLIGISMIFIAFANVFIESGFSNALIRKVDRTDIDLSTAFYFNLIMGVMMFAILFFIAPLIAQYFEADRLISLVRIVAIMVLMNSLCIVQNAILTSELRIKIQTIINIISLIPSGVIAIYLAYKGFGVYALAIQSVLCSVIRTIALWVVTKWRPLLIYSNKSMKYLWNFGSKLIAANFLGTVFNEIYTVIIGKFVGKEDLGYYSKARSLSTQPDLICNGVIQKIAIPIFSKYQNDKKLLLIKYRNATKLIFFCMGLVSSILIAIAQPLIMILWSEKWLDSVFPFQMLLVASLFSPPSSLNLSLLQVINHTGYTLKLEFIKKPLFLILILLGSNYGLYGLLYIQVIISVLAVIINMKASQKYIKYSFYMQFIDIIYYLIAVIISSSLSFLMLETIEYNIITELFIGIVLATSIYILFLVIVKDSIVKSGYTKLISFVNTK